MYFNEIYHSYSLPGPHDTDDILKVIGSKVKVTDNILRKCTVFSERELKFTFAICRRLSVYRLSVVCL